MQNEIQASNLLDNINFTQYLNTISNYVKDFNELQSKLEFNIFSLISERYHLENLHSDIIYKLLHPDGGHKEGKTFLNFFLDGLLKIEPGFFEKDDFENALVNREENRIDISIIDKVNKCAIIIENKINGAVDQDRQIERYIEALKGHYTIKAIVYLNLHNYNKPNRENWKEENKEILKKVLIVMPAFNSTNHNLVRLWIEKCATNEKSDENNRQIFHQYKNLIIKITNDVGNINANTMMYEKFKEESGDFLNKSSDFYYSMQTFRNYLAIKINEKFKLFEHDKFSANLQNFEWDGTTIVCGISIDLTEKGIFLYKFRIYPYNFRSNQMESVNKLLEELNVDLVLKDNELIRYFNFPKEETILYEFLEKFLKKLKV